MFLFLNVHISCWAVLDDSLLGDLLIRFISQRCSWIAPTGGALFFALPLKHGRSTVWQFLKIPMISLKKTVQLVVELYECNTVDGRNPAPPGMYKTM